MTEERAGDKTITETNGKSDCANLHNNFAVEVRPTMRNYTTQNIFNACTYSYHHLRLSMIMKWAPVQTIQDEISTEGRVTINDTCVIRKKTCTQDSLNLVHVYKIQACTLQRLIYKHNARPWPSVDSGLLNVWMCISWRFNFMQAVLMVEKSSHCF